MSRARAARRRQSAEAPRVGTDRAPLRPWQRLSLRLAACFAAGDGAGRGLVGALIYERQKREVEDTVGTQLLNIARVAALLVDPGSAGGARRRADSTRTTRIGKALATIQRRGPADHADSDS